jgi:Serine hydrolase (FSH1)
MVEEPQARYLKPSFLFYAKVFQNITSMCMRMGKLNVTRHQVRTDIITAALLVLIVVKIGIPPMIPGPFLCYFNGHTCDEIQEAHDLLEAIIEEEGPFDGVFSFSQGASLTISYLLQLERQKPRLNPPFKFAVFFSPSVAFCPDLSFCFEEIATFNELEYDYFASVCKQASAENDATATGSHQSEHLDYINPDLWQAQPDFEMRKRIVISSLGGVLRAGVKSSMNTSLLLGYIERRDTKVFPRVFHPAMMSERICIPVVHVTGLQDNKDLQSQFKVMPLLCKESMTRKVVHQGGHDLPRAPDDIREVVKAIAWAIAEGDMPIF